MAEEDIIFGKKRHFFGGIEPSNMKMFRVEAEVSEYSPSTPSTPPYIKDGKVTIHVHLPDDTVVNDQTLCTVAGAIIRRASDRYPKDEFDGYFVADIKDRSPITVVDDVTSTATPGMEIVEQQKTWYYAAFPYTTQDVYNRSTDNRASINETESLTGCQAVRSESDGKSCVKITIRRPRIDSIDNTGNNDFSIKGVFIRRSTTHYPESPTDGDEVLTLDWSDSNSLYIHNDLDVVPGSVYYYSVFPYGLDTCQALTNYSTASCSLVECGYHFGYDLDTKNSDPAARVTYPTGVDNASYTPAKMTFNSDPTKSMFSYGGWPSVAGEKFMPKPCMLNPDGTVEFYLNPNNYTQKYDGGSSNISSSSNSYNAMMQWPKIYTKRWMDDNGVYHFRCSDVKLDADYECWCNYARNNNEIPYFYTAIYPSYRLTNTDINPSKSFSKVCNASTFKYNSNDVASAYTDVIFCASRNGPDWYITTMADMLLITDLLTMMGKSTNLVSVYGVGNQNTDGATNSSSSNYNNRWEDKGLFYGHESTTYRHSVKVFGMVDWWGYPYEYIAGWINKYGEQFIKLTRGTKDGSSCEDYNITGNGYIKLPFVINTTGYVTKCETTPYGRIPVESGYDAAESKYECGYIANGMKTVSIAYTLIKPYRFVLDQAPDAAPDTARVMMTGRLSCKPSAK